ncbi:MAG: hypothetical protein JWP61_2283 [Friedmanniella sp.]|nr:hypothetical protein [Friedmanniella sp.]
MDSQVAKGGTFDGRHGDPYEWSQLRSTAPEADPSDDPWAWADQQDAPSTRRDVSTADVTAVLVAFDAARWLPATLAGLGRLQDRPRRLIAIDNESSDLTRMLLERARDQGILDAVYAGEQGYGFGRAVQSALRQDRAATGGSGPTTGPTARAGTDERWLWLLHDDAVPAPDTLHRLLEHVLADRTIDITGPKLLLPRRRQTGQQISEVGTSISGTGRRELQLETGEIDQGQRDQPQPRLGVSTCGLLVKLAVWQDLDGLDPALPVFRDGVEFGWRAHLNGYRVVTTPAAEMTHRQVGRAGLRPRGLTGRRPARLDRLLGMTVVAGHAPGRLLPAVWLLLVLSCLLRAAGYLLGKVPGRARDELVAMVQFVAHPGRLRDLRRRTAAIDPLPGSDEVVRSLRPPWWSALSTLAETFTGAASQRYRSVAGDAEAATLDELTGDDFSSVSDDATTARWLNPVTLVIAATLVGALVAARGLYGTGSLTAPALLPAASSLGDLWDSVWNPIAGAPGQIPPPWLALTALGSTVAAGQPEWFITLMLCGVVPLSLLAVYPLARKLVVDRRVRLWLATTYALLPVLLGGTNQGRLELTVFAVGLPLLANAARALVLRRVRTPEAWRGGWGAGLVLVVLVAFQPSFLVVALLLGALGAVLLRRTPRKIGRIGIALGLPLVLLLPWWPSLITAPGRLFVGPDAALDGAPTAPAVWRLLLGHPTGPGLPPLWVGAVVFGVIWVVALVGLGRRPRRRVVLAAWVTALVAFALAVLLSRLVVDVPPVATEVRPWTGAYLLVGFAALLVGGAVGVDGLTTEMQGRSFSWLQPAAVLAAVAVGLVSVGGAAWWVWAGARGPVDRLHLSSIPPYVMNAMTTGGRPRVLALDLSGSAARYSVLAGDQLRLGDADRGFAYAGSAVARQQVADLVVRLVAGTADADIAPELTGLGVGYVWVSGADEDERSRIDNTPGLGTASGNNLGTVWQLDPAVSRAALADGTALAPLDAPPTTVPAGSAGRLLLVGEPVDRRWRGSLDGRPLARADHGWQQAFVLPAEGGTVTYRLSSVSHWLLLLQGLVLLVAAVLAAPAVRRPEVRDPTTSARRAATLSEIA